MANSGRSTRRNSEEAIRCGERHCFRVSPPLLEYLVLHWEWSSRHFIGESLQGCSTTICLKGEPKNGNYIQQVKSLFSRFTCTGGLRTNDSHEQRAYLVDINVRKGNGTRSWQTRTLGGSKACEKDAGNPAHHCRGDIASGTYGVPYTRDRMYCEGPGRKYGPSGVVWNASDIEISEWARPHKTLRKVYKHFKKF